MSVSEGYRRKRLLSGTVVSDKMTKSIVVQVVQRQKHWLYKKYVTQRKKYLVHDEHSKAKRGDIVEIRESRPLSARKRFALSRIIEQAAVTGGDQ